MRTLYESLLDDESFGLDVVKYVKKGIAKKRSKTPFQTMYRLEQSIMELVYEILPMDYIEKIGKVLNALYFRIVMVYGEMEEEWIMYKILN